MPINIQTNIGPTMRSLSEQGTFRNSMYHQQEQKKKEKQKVTVRPTLVKDDVAAHFVKNEEFRLQSAGLQNEISHLEEEISIVQTAAGALERVEDLLIQMKELLVIVTNETEYNAAIRKADQDELVHLINRINKVADETSYGHQSLLDGSHGVRGVASGEHLEFVGMNTDSKTSPLNGYEVVVTEVATRSELQGLRPFTQDMVNNEEQLIFEAGGISYRFTTQRGESVSCTFNRLASWISDCDIPLEIVRHADEILHFKHLQYGSAYDFGASSLTRGLISLESQEITLASSGLDVKGMINGMPCLGHGQYLSAPDEADDISGLTVRYTGNEAPIDKMAGTVSVAQSGFQFQIGHPAPHVEQLSLGSIHTSFLGADTKNVSGFNSLQEIDIKNGQRVKDSICVLEKSLKEVSDVRARVEMLCDNQFKSSMQNLQNEYNKIIVTEQNIENSAEARAFAEQTGNIIAKNSGRSSIAQAHQNPEIVLTLLK